jgi:glycolate oxidase
MQLVRLAFDPQSLANPGKIFPTPARCGESQRRLETSPASERMLQDADVF